MKELHTYWNNVLDYGTHVLAVWHCVGYTTALCKQACK